MCKIIVWIERLEQSAGSKIDDVRIIKNISHTAWLSATAFTLLTTAASLTNSLMQRQKVTQKAKQSVKGFP